MLERQVSTALKPFKSAELVTVLQRLLPVANGSFLEAQL